ncbi:thiamine pyrophosphate-binding protein [Sphingobacterium psychroaquaticum]|uniref:thiamine pyrophosphate-dependent enzyme n=1 Tax=Sphingobacterium psychroaquaticum TaxID=561061 RepID=UPI00106C7EB1|nr:thiamine pyrophosphate-dependent enzyme [Sphingobacterium psychroaquaticum]QBQ41333.1 thiamine pyrophosphate-binding protein [Sphingobacterium psychroaquaticum]
MKESLNITDTHPLVALLSDLHVKFFAGVTGGGVIHFLKHIARYSGKCDVEPAFFTIGEYVAGFIPLGYYLSSGTVAASVATTGAATKLIGCGLSDAKLHNIPSVYIVPLCEPEASGFGPLQDTSVYGSNILAQLQAELPDSTFVLDETFSIDETYTRIQTLLQHGKPVVFVLTKSSSNIDFGIFRRASIIEGGALEDLSWRMDYFILKFRQAVQNRRVVIVVGDEMRRCARVKELTTQLSLALRAETIWSINGANAVSRENPYGYGYISFGGNDKAMEIFRSLGEDDVVLLLGGCSDEYTTNLKKIIASDLFYLGEAENSYGMVNNSFAHITTGNYDQVLGDVHTALTHLITKVKEEPCANIPARPAPADLNNHAFIRANHNYVDMVDLYQRLDNYWRKNSIAFDDVCLAYKDRQYILSRPNDNIDFYSLYRGSAMGGAFGTAVGAKIANPERDVYCFTGDGCFRLFAGCLGEAAKLGIVLFLLNNERLGIVDQGLRKVLHDFPEEQYHADVIAVDYQGVALSFGWNAARLLPDLSNLSDVLDQIEPTMERSLLIEVPIDPNQLLGSNPRLVNL